MSLGRCVSEGDEVVSTKKTTGASSPLAPCTVMTRTSSREISMSRFTSRSAVRSHATNPCSEAGGLALIPHRKFEKFAERVIGFMAKPLQDFLPATVAAEQPGIECEWRFGSETAFAFFETIKRVPEFAVRRGVQAQGAAQRSLALPCQFEQIVLVEAEQRALQCDRERQIVLRQQKRIGKVYQVDDRDMFGQFQPVGAGNGNAGVLQRLDHGVEGVAAPPHQDQHVAIAQAAARAG